MASVRVLRGGDEPPLRRFLEAHADTTLFLQSNLRAAGLEDRGQPQQGSYAAVFSEAGAIEAVACHCWNGNVLLEAPVALPEVVRAAVAASGRAVRGLLGRHEQVCAARRALGLDAAPANLDSREDLFSLALASLQVPPSLAEGALACRPPRADELPLLVAWRCAYRVEVLGEARGAPLDASSAEEMERYQQLGRHFVLEAQGRPVAYAAYNAATPECVQMGGVFTPPALRGRGYGRAVVAGALLAARGRGVARSVLFTPIDNAAAQAAYRALGYRRVGDYALLLFA